MTLVKKAHELGKLCDVDIAVIICRNGRYFTYRSMDRQSWPPSMEQIEISYPLPENLLPRDIETSEVKGTIDNTLGSADNSG